MVSHAQLSAFCILTNKALRKFYGRPDCCVFSTGVVCEVLTHFGIHAEPLRIEAAIFPDDRKLHGGVVLGSLSNDTRRPAAAPDKWKGHLVTLAQGVYLVDTTFDQVNIVGRPDLRAEPLVIDLRETKWFDPDPPYGCPWTGCLRMFDALVRFTRFPRQIGWKSAGDFQPSRRQPLVQALIASARPIFENPIVYGFPPKE